MPFTPNLHCLTSEQWRAAMDDVAGGRASPAFAEFGQLLSPQAQLISTLAERQIYARDLAELPSPLAALFEMRPSLVVQPSTPKDVAVTLRWAKSRRLPVTPRGLASSAYGGAVPARSGVVLDLVRMNTIGELDRKAETIEVQAGVKWGDLDQQLARYGYEPATYPSSRFSTVGAWAITGGYGINAFGGGHFSGWIESLQVVLPDGSLIRCEKGTPEFERVIGTEGQLGVITSLRLRVKPRVTCLPVLVYCESGADGVALVEAVIKAGLRVQHIKLLDHRQMRSLNRLFHRDYPGQADLYQEQDAVFLTFEAQAELDKFEALLHTLSLSLTLAPRYAAMALWHERFFPMKTKRFGPSSLAAQVLMPLAQTARYVQDVSTLAGEFGLETATETYVVTQPDGTHAALVMPAFTCDARRPSYLLHLVLVQIMTRLGIKRGGRPYAAGLWNGAFAREKYGDRYETLCAAKRGLDPDGLLNPGKFPRVRTRLGWVTDWIFRPTLFQSLIDGLYLATPLIGAMARLLDRIGPKSDHHTSVPLTDAELEEAIRACTACGDCLPVCPAYLITADETVVGRTKLRTGLKVLYNQPIDRRESDHTFLCMHCSACQDVCQSALPLISMYEKIEAKLAERYGRPDELIAEFLYQAQTSPAFYPFVGASVYPPPQPEMPLASGSVMSVARAESASDTTADLQFPDYDDSRPVLDPESIPVNRSAQGAKYHIKTITAAPRVPLPGKFRIHRADHCINCGQCERACVYGVHFRRPEDLRRMAEPADSLCRNCFRCVQECPKLALTMSFKPEYQAMGRGIFTADIVSSLMKQAESGQIPVFGQGYRGPFAGPGFDGMWTDMSEIVRPTRDGIHGREYISTGVVLGRRPDRLRIDPQTRAVLNPSERPMLELPLPVIFGRMPPAARLPVVMQTVVGAAHRLQILAEVNIADWCREFDPYAGAVILQIALSDLKLSADLIGRVPVIELTGDDGRAVTNSGPLASASALAEAIRYIRRINAGALIAIRLPVESSTPGLALELARNRAIDILWLAGEDGLSTPPEAAPNLVEGLPQVHQALVEAGIRDQVTLIASGGLAMAEHCPKSLILGADAVVVDWPLAIALECRLNGSCVGNECACGLQTLDPEWGRQRIVNLMGAWRLQILEVLGAMGLREICRLRGERGRALFAADLEKLFFVPLMSITFQEASELPGRFGRFLTNALLPPERLRHRLGPWHVTISRNCIDCGLCVEVCPAHVFQYEQGRHHLAEPRHGACQGPDCNLCINECPVDAITLGSSASYQCLGDRRWTNDLLTATFHAAETGQLPLDRETSIGASEGGFDRLRFRFPEDSTISPEKVDLSLPLNRRGDDRPLLEISLPAYGGGMSFGSISLPVMLARAMAAQALNTFTCTGEGGYPEPLVPYADWIITQVATGLFGVREETIQWAPIVEFKYAQGAKPGLGGHLLGDKVTAAVAQVRDAVQGASLFSPFPFHSVYSVEDHKKHVDWIKTINPRALISVKVSTPDDVDMVAVGSYYAGAHIVHLDGGYGGTGAAPEIAKKNIALPIEYAVCKTHRFLEKEGIRDEITLMASGGIRTAHDALKIIALGADGVVIGTAEMVAVECVRCGNCESGRGCPLGIATTDAELSSLIAAEWAAQRILNLYAAWMAEWRQVLARLGMRSIRELRGRTDVLEYV